MGTKAPPPLVPVRHEPGPKAHHVARARAGGLGAFSPGWLHQPGLKGLGVYGLFFLLILCFPFNSFSFQTYFTLHIFLHVQLGHFNTSTLI